MGAAGVESAAPCGTVADPAGASLIHLSIDEARAVKWRRGRERYGPVFSGDPLEELDGELLDGLNYAEEAARRGLPMAGVLRDLRELCERVRAVHASAGARR